MLTLLFELVNVQLPSLLLGVSFVFSSYLCYTRFASLSALLSFTSSSSSPLSFLFFSATTDAGATGDKRSFALSIAPSFSFFSSPAPFSLQLGPNNMDSSSVPLEVFSTSSASSAPPQPSLNSSASFPTTAGTANATAAANAARKVSKAKLLRLGSSMGMAVPLALTRRVWKGAAYASWSVGFEVQHEMGQALLRNHHRFSLTDLCQLSADFAAGPPTDSSSVRTVYCGGIRADMVQYHSPITAHRRKSLSSASSTSSSSSSSSNIKLIDRNLSKSEGGSRGTRVAYRSKRQSQDDGEVELQNLSKSSTTTTTTLKPPRPVHDNSDDRDDNDQAVGQATTSGRTKLSTRRIKSENDNLGRDNQFVNHAQADDDDDYNDDEPAATVMYLHGGGFCVGSATTYRRCLWHFSREMKGLRFLAVDYSLSPNVRFPTALQECLHAYLWLIDENGGNVPPEKVVLAGDSAGGCLVLALLFLIRQMRDDAAAAATNDEDKDSTETEADEEDDDEQEQANGEQTETESKAKGNTKLPFALPSRKTPPAFPLCAFLMSPWVDLSDSSSVMQPESYAQTASYRSQSGLARRFINAYLGNDDDAAAATGKKSKANAKATTLKQGTEETRPDVLSPYISPLYGDMHGLPPVMLTAGGEEPLLADIRALHDKCVEAGLEVELDVGEHMNHAYQVFHDPSAHREIERSIQAVGRFVWRHIAQRQLD